MISVSACVSVCVHMCRSACFRVPVFIVEVQMPRCSCACAAWRVHVCVRTLAVHIRVSKQ